jgi:hypothetical protein
MPLERDGLPRESAGRPDVAVWPGPDSLSVLNPRPGAGRWPGPGELPAPLERDGLPRESAARPSRPAQPDEDARSQAPPSAERPLSPSGTTPPDSPRPRSGNRPPLAAKLSLADLARVRQALALLSEEAVTAAEEANGATDGPVPSSRTVGQQAGADRSGEDETDTVPMPVVLHGGTDTGRSDAAEAPPRAPFEPARPSQQASRPEPDQAAEPDPAESGESLPPAAAAKLDEIKDLLLTAEAIGEYNLDQHFEQVSQRQRELIREFFDQARPGRDASA